MSSDSGAFDAVRRHMAPGLALGAKMIGRNAVEVRADGAAVQLSDGRELIDFGSYAVTLLGHRHPAVVAAVAAQLERMPTTTRVLANAVVAEFVEDLVRRLPEPLERVWLGSDGADAVEVALKLARRQSGRMRVLAAEGGFHGKTLGALDATWNPRFREALEPLLANVTHIDPRERDAVRRAAAAGDVAALIVEPIQGEAGVRPVDPEVLRRWADDARAAGAFLISDEIQCGLRRCGPFSPAVDLGLRPDAVLFAKALGGGIVPLAAVVATPDLHAPLAHDPTWHTSTFGGNPLACAAGRAALAAIDELAAKGERTGERFGRGLRSVAAAHPELAVEVRGAGLLWGLELVTPGAAGSMLVELAHAGLLVSPCLSSPQTIRLLPPMVASDDQVDRALEIVDVALDASAEYADDVEPVPT